MPDMTDATPTIEEMVTAVEWQVRKLDSFTRNHPRRSDAPPGPDLADRELSTWRAVLSTLSSLSPLIEAAREVLQQLDKGYDNVAIYKLGAVRDALSTFPAPGSQWREAAEFLFGLLDDIDTASDRAKGNDKAYREIVERLHRRRFEAAETDGYTVTFKPRRASAETE